MNDDEKAALEDALVQLAQHEAALSDLVGIICYHLSMLNPTAAATLVKSLEAISNRPGIEVTPAFQTVSAWAIHNLEGKSEMQLRSFRESGPHRTSREELRRLLRLVPGGKDQDI